MHAPLVGQTDDGIYDVTRHNPRHQTLHSQTQCHPHLLPGVYQSINQASKQKKASIAPYFASESDASHCAQRALTTSITHAMTTCCQFDHPLIIGYKNSKIKELHIPIHHYFGISITGKTQTQYC